MLSINWSYFLLDVKSEVRLYVDEEVFVFLDTFLLVKFVTASDTVLLTAVAVSLAAFNPVLIVLVTTFVAEDAEGRGAISGMVVGITGWPLYVVIPTDVKMNTARTNTITYGAYCFKVYCQVL
jgi:Na+/proline symporter